MSEMSTSGVVTGATHQLQALCLRKEGNTYKAIGRALGGSRSRTHPLVLDELAR
jgi:hypothetical protein